MENLKVVVPEPVKAPELPKVTITSSSKGAISFLRRLYNKKLYVLLLLVAIGGAAFYYKKKNNIKNKLKDFNDLHNEYKPATELNKDLLMKENELASLKVHNNELVNENTKLQQQQSVLLQSQQQMQMQLNQLLQEKSQVQMNNNDRLETNVQYNNLGEDENVQQFNLTNNEMNEVNEALEQ